MSASQPILHIFTYFYILCTINFKAVKYVNALINRYMTLSLKKKRFVKFVND